MKAMSIMKRWALSPALAEDYFGGLILEPPAQQPDQGAPRDGATGVDEIALNVNGETVALGFDTSQEYSSIKFGLVQAAYYGYSADNATLYELYLIFPDTVRPGMVLTPEYAALANEECSVVLIVSGNDAELYYSASMMNGTVYPAGSAFSIAIDAVEEAQGGSSYAGSFSATLIALDGISGDAVATLSLPETAFRFTIGV